jgi:hypothetical protein
MGAGGASRSESPRENRSLFDSNSAGRIVNTLHLKSPKPHTLIFVVNRGLADLSKSLQGYGTQTHTSHTLDDTLPYS